MTAQAYEFRRYALSRLRHPATNPIEGRAAIIVACRGLDAGLSENLRCLLRAGLPFLHAAVGRRSSGRSGRGTASERVLPGQETWSRRAAIDRRRRGTARSEGAQSAAPPSAALCPTTSTIWPLSIPTRGRVRSWLSTAVGDLCIARRGRFDRVPLADSGSADLAESAAAFA